MSDSQFAYDEPEEAPSFPADRAGKALVKALEQHTRRMMAATIFATANTERAMTVQEALTHADTIISLTKESPTK